LDKNNFYFEKTQKLDDARDEFSQELVENRGVVSTEDEKGSSSSMGITSFVLALLSMFILPFFLAPISIVIGVLSVKRGSVLGWWAIFLGIMALILRVVFGIVLLPVRLIF